MSRTKILHAAHNSNSDIVYFMSKSFRIKNNYSLYEALRLKEKYQSSLSIYIMNPIESSTRNRLFFQEKTKDLVERLDLYSNSIYRLDWSDLDLDEFINVKAFVLDKPYLKEDIKEKDRIVAYAKEHDINVLEVDSNTFQPTESVSSKEEYSARTIRDKIWKMLLQPLVLMKEDCHRGEKEAFALLQNFIEEKIEHYEEANDPSKDYRSGLSPYLKYGFISPNVIYDIVMEQKPTGYLAFLEELIIRRDLAYNFVRYNPHYDEFNGITYPWAYQTMSAHEEDPRSYLYTKEDYIRFETHDPYFNAAMKEMIYFGRMHSYMRMYWAKKIIEWSKTYEEAYEIAITLNNEYFYDGNTPNGYTGVAWCFGKHDRAWTERPIFGKLRYMNENGLKRKFDIDLYVEHVEELVRREEKQ